MNPDPRKGPAVGHGKCMPVVVKDVGRELASRKRIVEILPCIDVALECHGVGCNNSPSEGSSMFTRVIRCSTRNRGQQPDFNISLSLVSFHFSCLAKGMYGSGPSWRFSIGPIMARGRRVTIASRNSSHSLSILRAAPCQPYGVVVQEPADESRRKRRRQESGWLRVCHTGYPTNNSLRPYQLGVHLRWMHYEVIRMYLVKVRACWLVG